MMVAPTVVFDLDGTLVDSAPDLVATLNIIFGRNGLPPVAFDAARSMVGGGARAMIAADGRNGKAAHPLGGPPRTTVNALAPGNTAPSRRRWSARGYPLPANGAR